MLFNYKSAVFNGVPDKTVYFSCEGGVEESVPHDYHSVNLKMPQGDPRD